MRPLPALPALLALFSLPACAAPAVDEAPLDEGAAALTGGGASADEAVVQIVHPPSGRRCAGAVIGADVVLTSATCLYGVLDTASLPDDAVGAGYVPSGLSFSVRFGPNAAAPTQTMTANHVSVWSRASDFALLALPSRAPARLPVEFTVRTSFAGAYLVGYDDTNVRRRADVSVTHAITFYDPLQVFGGFPFLSPATIDLQDRGAPIIVGGRVYALASSFADGDNGFSGDSTAGTTPVESSSLRSWLRQSTELSACGTLAWLGGVGRRALYHWQKGTEHLTTTDVAMSGCYAGDYRRIDATSGHDFVAIEGYAVPPASPTPAGGRELRLFRNSLTQENATSTTDLPPAIGGGYNTGTRIGSIFSVATSDRLELFRFFNPITHDFLTKVGPTAPSGYGSAQSLGFVYRDSFTPIVLPPPSFPLPPGFPFPPIFP